MTREEAIYTLEQMKTWSKDLSDDEIEALVTALKALEQEPLTDVLDKIRAEIENIPSKCIEETLIIYDALDIIDKFKADKESEK